MFSTGNEKSTRKKKLNYSNSFRNQSGELFSEVFNREDEARHSTGSMKGHYVISSRFRNDVSLKYPISNNRNEERNMNGKRSGSNESQYSDKEEQKTPSHSVSYLIKGFESKGDSPSDSRLQIVVSDDNYTYTDGDPSAQNDKHKRNGSKRKLSIRKRTKASHDANITVLQKLGIAPFMGSENRSPKKALSYFDVQSILFSINDAAVLKSLYEEGGNRPRNISTGASAASIRGQRKKQTGEQGQGKALTRTDSVIDEGDGVSNELVLSCPYFRNETGNVETRENNMNSVNKLLGKYRGDVASRIWTSFGKHRTPSLELIPTTDNDNDMFFDGNVRLNEIDQKKDVSILEPVESNSKVVQWDNPKNCNEKRIFDFEHIDDGALYYREFFAGKEHQNFLGIDEKYGPVSISMIRENVEKMAVLGHPKENSKNRTNKYQYRIILRTTELRTFRGTVLEESIPSTTRHGSSRALPPRDVLEFCFPDLQLSCLRLAITGPKVPEQLQKLDEQQLSLQYKVGLLYCKAGQNSEEDMYNNEYHDTAFDEFLDVIGERVLLKGFEGYRAQLDNKNDSTGIYSLYAKYHNREIMFHVSTLLPWTPNNKQQLLRKRHIGNDIVTVIFQEPGAEPFTPKNIRSHFQHVFIIVRVENPGTEHTTYKVAVSRSQDVPTFGPPIPPNSSFKNNKAFKDFLLSKICNAENAAHKSQKFTAMAVRTRFEYLKDLATNFVSATTIDTGGAKFSKFNPMSLSVKRKEKIHPPCNPEVWCQGGLVWSVKVDLETTAIGSLCHMAISTKIIVLIDKTSKEILVSIPCKTVIGWRTVGNSMKLYYNNGQGLNICLIDEDVSEMTFVINRLKAVTPGCETQDMSLRRSPNGQLGFHVYYEGLVAEVEPYGMAWQAGLRKGSRLLEISNRFVSKMSHDRMIQALKKPGSIRVVVLPPLPDGQPRNYKSTRNLKRYSSMTSVYSEMIHNSSDSSLSSSRENLTLDFDTVTPIRVGGKEITTVEARMKQSTPYSVSKSNQSRRPHGFILDSDQSLELTEGSSTENPLSSLNRKTTTEPKSVAVKEGTPYSNSKQRKETDKNMKKIALDQRDSAKSNDKYGGKLPLDHRTSPSNSSLGSVDPELTELERTITDTRKSIDAKFYKSLVQGSAMRKNLDRSKPPLTGSRADYKKSQEELRKSDENTQEPFRPRKNSSKQRPSPPNFASLNLNTDKDEIKRTLSSGKTSTGIVRDAADNRLSADNLRASDNLVNGVRNTSNSHIEECKRKPSDGSQSGSTNSGNTRPSPPPYEEAISSLDRRKMKMKQAAGTVDKDKVVYRHYDRPFPTSSGTDSNKEDKPKHLTSTSERKRYRSLVKSANLEDLRTGIKGIIGETTPSNVNKGPQEYKITKNRLVGAYSESNICKSVEQDGKALDGSIVHTRVRDVNDVINEINHIRSCSADQLSGFSSLLPRSRAHRSSSIDAAMPDAMGSLALPADNAGNNKLPYKETTLGAVPTTVETYSPGEENLTDTFTKIDQAFGFTTYAPPPDTSKTSSNKDEKRRKKTKHRHRSQACKITSESSDESSSESSSSVRRRNGKPREGRPKSRPLSSDSLKRNKSEAEESLEAAITDFHSTLSNLPDQHSSLDIVSSSDTLSGTHTPTPSDHGFSSVSNQNEETPKAANSAYKNPKNDSRLTVVKRDYTATPKTTFTYSDVRRKVSVRSAGRQSSQEGGSRVQELVGKFSDPLTRKGSLDSSTPSRSKPETFRSRSEVRISSLASPSPWVKREPPKQSYSRMSEGGRDVRRFERHRISHQNENKNESGLSSSSSNSTPVRKKISVTVTPKMSFEKKADTNTPVVPNSPSWLEACERGMLSLPGRGKKTSKSSAKDFFDMPLTVRGLDLAPQRAQELEASSKEDLRLMLTVLSGELAKEKHEKERLIGELEQAKVEKEQLLEQSQVAASQLRKFTSWFYDSVSKDPPNIDEN